MLEKLSRGETSLPATVATTYQGNAPGYAYFSFRDRNDRVLVQSVNVPADAVTLPVPATGVVEETRTVKRRRELSRSADFGLRVVIGRDISPEIEQRRRFAWSLAAAGIGVWVIGLLGGWWLAGRAIRPIQSISRTASRIAEGNLNERIIVEKGAGELRDLGGVLNRTFDRLRHALELQRQFTADAAHELRTPITILAAETQRILKRERSPEEYRAAFETCAGSIARMRRLVEDLLLLTRQESTISPCETCDLAEIARDTVQHLSPLAAEKHLQLHTEFHPALCTGHPASLTVVIANLVSNAIQHHDRAEGHIHISTQQDDDSAILTVRDDGPGIAPEDLPHIFDRFYRADKSRTTTDSQHTGLGLSIVKTIIESHGGSVGCQSTPYSGATFIITLRRVSAVSPQRAVRQGAAGSRVCSR
jgi:heavy metal sensor kinase